MNVAEEAQTPVRVWETESDGEPTLVDGRYGGHRSNELRSSSQWNGCVGRVTSVRLLDGIEGINWSTEICFHESVKTSD